MGQKWSEKIPPAIVNETDDFLKKNIHESMAQVANFTPNYQLFTISLERNSTKLSRRNIANKQGVIVSKIFHFGTLENNARTMKFSHFQHYSFQKHYAAVTPSECYTNWEKIFMPFDLTSWIMFGISFAIVFLAILIINRQSRDMRNIIYGKGIKNPGYNAAGGFFGVSQLKMPIENCPRILITFFLYFCLVFRTCYQGRMFDFMTTDMRKPAPETIEELVDQDYLFVSHTRYTDPYADKKMYACKLDCK